MNQDPAGIPPQQPVHMAKDGTPPPPPGYHPPGAQQPGAYPPGANPYGAQAPGAQPPGSYPHGSQPPGPYPPGTPGYGAPGYAPANGYPAAPPRRGGSVPVWLLVAIPVLLVVAVIIVAAVVIYANRPEDKFQVFPGLNPTTTSASASIEYSGAPLPAPDKRPATVSCAYRANPGPQEKASQLPKTTGVSADTTGIRYEMATGLGAVGLILKPGQAPCTVNSFTSLAAQHYFDGTSCHRITTSEGLKVLQCGDPTGTGMGGPGYQFDDEYPIDHYGSGAQAAAQPPLSYSRGTLAMANAGPGTNGSQFFLVYGDSLLPPSYTVFGTVDAAGLAILDKVAAAGVAGGGADGTPSLTVQINSVAAK